MVARDYIANAISYTILPMSDSVRETTDYALWEALKWVAKKEDPVYNYVFVFMAFIEQYL